MKPEGQSLQGRRFTSCRRRTVVPAVVAITVLGAWHGLVSARLFPIHEYDVMRPAMPLSNRQPNLLFQPIDAQESDNIEPTSWPADTEHRLEALKRARDAVQQEVHAEQQGAFDIQPDWTLLSPKYAGSKRLFLNVELHHFEDRYGLIAVPFSEEDIVQVLQGVVNVWAQANIHIRFDVRRSLERRPLTPQREDAYLYYAMAPKPRDYKSAAQAGDTALSELRRGLLYWLAQGPLGKEGAFALSKVSSPTALLAWITGFFERDPWQVKNEVHVYLVRLFRQYNGYGTPSGIFARAGACGPDLEFQSYFPPPLERLMELATGYYSTADGTADFIKSNQFSAEDMTLADQVGESDMRRQHDASPPRKREFRCRLGYGDRVADKRYGFRKWEAEPISKQFLVRVIAHEIGHQLRLKHPRDNACVRYESIQEANLMQQQRSVALRGSKCSMENAAITVNALKLESGQIEKARQALMSHDVPMVGPLAGHLTVGPSTQVNPQSRPQSDSGSKSKHRSKVSLGSDQTKSMVMLHLSAPAAGHVQRLRFRHCPGAVASGWFHVFVASVTTLVLDDQGHAEAEARDDEVHFTPVSRLVKARMEDDRKIHTGAHVDVFLDRALRIEKGQYLGVAAAPGDSLCFLQIRAMRSITRPDGVVTAGDFLRYRGSMGISNTKLFRQWTEDDSARRVEVSEVQAETNIAGNMDRLTLGAKHPRPCTHLTSASPIAGDEAQSTSVPGTLRRLKPEFCLLFNFDMDLDATVAQ